MVKKFRVDNKTLLLAAVKRAYPQLKHDWYVRHYKMPSHLVRRVYLKFRELSKKVELVSIDELAIELELPVKAVISAVQDIYETELSPVIVISTSLTEYIAGAELLEDPSRLNRLVEKATQSSYYRVLQSPLKLMKYYGVDVDGAPTYNELEDLIEDIDIEGIDL